MRLYLARLLCAGILFLFGSTARAAVIGFDDLTNLEIPAGYGGFVWPAWTVNAGSGSSWHSPPNVAWSYGYSFVLSGSPFSFNDAWFATLDTDFLRLQIIGFDGYGNVICTKTITDLSGTAQLYSFGWSGLAALQFVSLDATGNVSPFTMDDFRVNEAAPVPEPATMLILSSGLLGLVAVRKKFRKI